MLNSTRASLFGALLALSAVTGCKKDNSTGLQVQAHDQSALMTIMHNMMMDMDKITKTQDPDNDFASTMSRHHQGAIDMANEELKNGTDSEMRAIAQSIITKQQAEIKQLQAFLTSHPAHTPAVPEFDALQDANMMRMDQANDVRPLTGNTDYDYAQLMVDHHQSAIENSDAEIKYGRESTMKTLAQSIIDDQKMEVTTFQTWLLKNKKF